MTLRNAFGNLALDTTVQGVANTLANGSISTNPANITTKFRDAFETFANGTNWILSQATGDIVQVDGNSAAASYLVISKDPLSNNTVTTLTSVASFDMPIELSVGVSMSQRTLGQEFSVELVSDETPITPPADLAISSVSQSTTTLTVNTAISHGLVPGMRIGIGSVPNSALNYPSLVVASTPAANQFTATAGPGGTIASVTAGPYTQGYVYYRQAMGGARNGTSQIFENATATNSSVYVRSNAGDALPTGTIIGNHSATIATTASVQAIAAALTYAFQPTTEYRCALQADRIQWYDSGVDVATTTTARMTRTQVVPDSTKKYKLRFRFTNNKTMTMPVAQVVSIIKTGTTTATVTTDVAHGLTTTDAITIYGVRDLTNFPVASLTVASVINSTQFTTVIGTASTTTSYGGFVVRTQGGVTMNSMGAIAQSVQTAAVAGNILTLTGSSAWTGFTYGDYVNLVGCRDISTGASLNIDGAYRVRDFATTTVYLEPVGTTTLPGSLSLTNCGGGVIKRTDARISFARVFDYLRQRVEVLTRPTGDIATGIGVNVQNVPGVTVSSGTVTTVTGITNIGANPANSLLYDTQQQAWILGVRRGIS